MNRMIGAANRFRQVLTETAGDRLVRNLGWYGLAEAASRFSRLAAAIVLARMLSATELGVAAVAITCFELVRVLTNNGIGQWVVRMAPERLEAACNTAHRALVAACCGALVVQLLLGLIIAWASGQPELLAMFACLAGVYLVMIPGLIPVYLLMRQDRIKAVAGISVAQVIADNVLTALLAAGGFGAWAIVLPKLLTAPIWLIGVLRCQRWEAKPAAGYLPAAELVRFSLPILASEGLSAARLNLDKLIVWALLGVEALGIYYFAFNAGIGLSMTLTFALSNSLYPQLALHAARPVRMVKRFDEAVRRVALPVAAIIALQAVAAFVYVPIVFGARWEHAAGLVAMLCASAISKPFFDSACQLLRASAMPRIELIGALGLTCATLAALASGLAGGLWLGIALYAAVAFTIQSGFAIWARRYVQRRLVASHYRRSDRIAKLYQTAGA